MWLLNIIHKLLSLSICLPPHNRIFLSMMSNYMMNVCWVIFLTPDIVVFPSFSQQHSYPPLGPRKRWYSRCFCFLTIKKLDKEAADRMPSLSAVAHSGLHVWESIIHYFSKALILFFLYLLFFLFLCFFFFLRGCLRFPFPLFRHSLAHVRGGLFSASLREFHVRCAGCFFTQACFQDFLPFTSILSFLQFAHHLFPVLGGLSAVDRAFLRFSSELARVVRFEPLLTWGGAAHLEKDVSSSF